MAVPETTVDENGLPRKLASVDPEPITSPME